MPIWYTAALADSEMPVLTETVHFWFELIGRM